MKGAGFGAAMGLAYFLLGFVFWTLRGRRLSDLSSDFLSQAVAVYVLGGAATGLLVGLAQPLITSLGRSMAVFFAASLPLATGVRWLFYSESVGAAPVAVLAGFFAMIGGTMYWNRDINS